jgi:hypothetical protein
VITGCRLTPPAWTPAGPITCPPISREPPRPLDGNHDGIIAYDMGAFERAGIFYVATNGGKHSAIPDLEQRGA